MPSSLYFTYNCVSLILWVLMVTCHCNGQMVGKDIYIVNCD